MHNRSARWTRAFAAAAMVALPLTAAAQTPPPATPPAQTTQPPATQPPAAQQPPATAPEASVDAAAAKQHLSDARDVLSQLTAMPEAAKLQGDTRTQVSQLISNFNELITTQANWRAAYGKVDANLSTLLGSEAADPAAPPASGVTGAVGTSGSTPALEPAVRTKLVEFRTQLKAFESAAGGGGMAPSAATDATTNPANPATAADPSKPAAPAMQPPPSSVTGTSGTTPPSPTATMAPADQAKAAEQVGHAEADKHLDAIDAILKESKTGALTKTQTAELKKHVTELRQILSQSK